MRNLLIFILTIFSINGWAIDSEKCSSNADSTIEGCMEEVSQSLLLNTSKEEIVCKLKSTALLTNAFNAKCSRFISSDDGSYGEYGKEIDNYLTEKGDSSVFLKNDLAGMQDGTAACPNWKNLSVDQKKRFWVWTMASIAKVESGCDPTAKNSAATNGTAIGLLQLDERPSARKWRGEECTAKSVTGAKENLRCGLDIMGSLISGQDGIYKSNGQIIGSGSNSYWQQLRQKGGGEIADLISQNPECKI